MSETAEAPHPSRLVALGSIIVDLLLDLPALPERGTDALATQVLFGPGGGFNTASAAARLGLPTVYAGPVGTGPMAERVLEVLAAEGIPALQHPDPTQDTGYCVTLVEPDGERTFVTVPGADGAMDPVQLALLQYRRGDALYLSGYDLAYSGGGALAAHVGRLAPGCDAGPLVVLDPGPMVADVPDDVWATMLPRVDVVSSNAREHDLLMPVLSRYGVAPVVVRRDGPSGAHLFVPVPAAAVSGSPTAATEPIEVAGYPVRAVDSTGAGDVHVGAMLAGLALGLGWVEAIDQANRAAAFSVTRRGGPSGPTPAELAAFALN